jgi:hypothetical protein
MKTPFSLHSFVKQAMALVYPGADAFMGGKYYPQSFSDSDSIKRLQQAYSLQGEQQFRCEHPILFNGMELQSTQDKVKRIFGSPDFKRVKNYGKHQLVTWMYKLYFCGIAAHAHVNLLEKDVVSYKYRLDTNGRNTVNKLKGILRLKYNLGDVVLGDYFIITDNHGNKLIFRNELELTVTYLSTAKHLQQRVNEIVNTMQAHRRRAQMARSAEMEFAL